MSTSSRQNQVSLLQSQAKHVFTRKAFKSVVWVGINYPPNGMDPKWALDIIIVHDPNYSEDEVWKLYSCEENNWGEWDPDRRKPKHAWNRKVKIERIFEGSFYCWSDVQALFHAETLHGDYNCQFLRNLRSHYLGINRPTR
ncbi:hypothetical protein V8E54_014851 [Elaphomyces granulatus]